MLRTTPGKGQEVYLLTRESFSNFDFSFEWNGEPGQISCRLAATCFLAHSR
jgi:hypothetical protein